MLPSIVIGIALVIALAAIVIALRVQTYLDEIDAQIDAQSVKGIGKKRIETLELNLSDLDERHQSLLTSHKRLQARVGMREARAAQKELEIEPEASEPDKESERDALKRMLALRNH